MSDPGEDQHDVGPDAARDQPSLSLPKAGGAIRGMGEKFSTNPVTGTASLSIPVTVTPGRGGITPQLSLSYDSGAGNGPFGLGWSMDLPSVSRRTDKGVPRYNGDDVFQLSGAEDLVRAEVPAPRVDGNFDIQAYRPRTEGLFSRIEQWRDRSSGDLHWRVTAKDNVISVFGLDPAARIADPADDSRVFRWLLERTSDDRGNVVSYDYKAEDRAGVDILAPQERNRTAPANRYLKRVRYGNVTPGADDDHLFEVVIDYGEHEDTPDEVAPWQPREDPFSTSRAGFEIRTHRLCRRILMFHRISELGPGPVLVASTDLVQLPDPVATQLVSVTHRGYVGAESDHLPPVTFEYSPRVVSAQWLPLETAAAQPPPRLDGGYRWTDLDGEGIEGVLSEEDGSWYYRSNLGDGMVDGPRPVDPLPVGANLARGQQLMDLGGTGRQSLTDFAGSTPGFHQRTEAGGWADFQEFTALPALAWDDPNLRFVDLTGDGLADVLLTASDGLTWYPSAGFGGYGDAGQVAAWSSEERGPVLVFADAEQCVYLADMSGDGLTDLVRVRNGEIAYWPNFGYGRFGPKITMSGAPVFDHPDRFDRSRVHLSDVDGSGPADLFYVGQDGVRFWFNQAGNSWSAPELIERAGVVGAVSVADLLGHGTACLVAAEPRPAEEPQVRYVDLMAAGKPRLMSTMDNGMGMTTSTLYESSTKFFLADKAAGRPWLTSLPFPVQVVTEVRTRDQVADTTLVTSYRYRHGYYDGVEREFRGFGYVEQRDAFDDTADDLNQPPAVTKRWQHTGWHGDQFSTRLAGEYWHGPLLPGTELPLGSTADEEREAARALRGHVLREEVYATDGTPLEEIPYSVTESTYQLRVLQSKGKQPYCVVLASAGESLMVHTERQPDDARTSHTLTLEIDDWGNVLRTAQIVYPRKAPLDDEQARLHVTMSEQVVVNDVGSGDRWRIGVTVGSRDYEVAGLQPPAGGVFARGGLDAGLAAAAQNEVRFQGVLSGSVPQRRLIAATSQTFSSEDLSSELPAGQLGTRALPWLTYRQAFADGQVGALFETRVTDDMLRDAGYLQRAGEPGWWSTGGRQLFDVDHFYLPTGRIDQFGAIWQVTYDLDFLLPVSVVDPLGNTVRAELNYRVMKPWLLTDANGNRTGVRFDRLGTVVATAVMGKTGSADGDALDLSTMEVSASDDPTTRLDYDLTQLPVRFHTFAREQHGAANPRWQESWTYADGTGRTVLTKVQAELSRWVGNGRVVYNNKGNPVKQYEPYFAADGGFDTEAELVQHGVTPILRYDPVGRLIRTDFPDGSLAEVVFDAWEQQDWDRNDTVLSSKWYRDRSTLPSTDPRNRAATLTAAHAGTPTRTRYDTLGRPHLSIIDNGSGQLFATAVEYDIQGNETSVTDARGVQVLVRQFDMLGRPAYSLSPDAGERWSLLDVSGKPVHAWDGKGAALRWSYDALRRRTHSYSGDLLRVRNYYGESLAGAVEHNLLTRACAVFDTAGLVRTTEVDFKGNTLRSDRRLVTDPHGEPDWSALAGITDAGLALSAGNALLDTGGYETQTAYDALNRRTLVTGTDGSVSRPAYNEANLLEKIDVRIRGAAEWTAFVTNIDYDAKGQRTLLEIGNGSRTRYGYEPDTYRLSTVDTRSPAGVALQSLNYVYDPVGNVLETDDAAQQTLFFANAVVPAGRSYTYEPSYRLSTAQGREHIGQTAVSQPGPDDGPPFEIPHANDAQAMRNYTENYSYDQVGNIVQLGHVAGTGSWTRRHDTALDSNRMRATSLPSDAGGVFSQPYTYDVNGNMTSTPQLRQLGWDVENRLVEVDLGGGGTAYYQYDAAGNRVRATVEKGGTTETRTYLGQNEIYRKTVAGNLGVERETLHVLDGTQRIALVETATTDPSPVPVQRYQLSDHLGSAVIELDEHCAVLSFEEYHPYGTTSFQSAAGAAGVSLKRYRFTGKEKDAETGLSYHGARYYAPWLGRWTSADPAGMTDGTNRYAYVRNRPVTMADPNGKWGVDMHFGAVYLAGRFAGASHEDALNAAIMSEGMDDFADRAAPTVKGVAGLAMLLPMPSMLLTGTTGSTQMRYGNNAHALNAPTWDAASAVAKRGIAANNVLEFGLGLHTVGDFLPHANTTGELTFGHQTGKNEDLSMSNGFLHDADFTASNPQKALATIVKFVELWAQLPKNHAHSFTKDELAAVGKFIYADDGQKGPALSAALVAAGTSAAELDVFNSYMWGPGAEEKRRAKFEELRDTKAGTQADEDAERMWLETPNDSPFGSRKIDLAPYLKLNPELPADARFEARKAANETQLSQEKQYWEKRWQTPVLTGPKW